MSEFNARFVGLDAAQRRARYRRLAEAALAHYPLASAHTTFLQHNGGVAYRVEAARDEQFVLKIAEPTGEGGGREPAGLDTVLAWLAALARETDLVVQEPVPNRDGGLLTRVAFEDVAAPFHCSLQRWVDGERVGHFTPAHARRVGAMVARLHRHGAAWVPPAPAAAHEQGPDWLLERLADLRDVVELGILAADEWAAAERAVEQIARLMAGLDRNAPVWGPVHGDLHHGNLLFHDGDVRPIDFGAFRRTHLAYDLGTALYHVMYQDAGVRRALVAGYGAGWLSEEIAGAAVCAAAIGNLAFQITIPRERASELFARNVRELATVFCQRLLTGVPFVLS